MERLASGRYCVLLFLCSGHLVVDPVTLRYLVSSTPFRKPVHGYLATPQHDRCVRSGVPLTLRMRTTFDSGC